MIELSSSILTLGESIDFKLKLLISVLAFGGNNIEFEITVSPAFSVNGKCRGRLSEDKNKPKEEKEGGQLKKKIRKSHLDLKNL